MMRDADYEVLESGLELKCAYEDELKKLESSGSDRSAISTKESMLRDTTEKLAKSEAIFVNSAYRLRVAKAMVAGEYGRARSLLDQYNQYTKFG